MTSHEMEPLVQALLNGDHQLAVQHALSLQEAGVDSQEIINQGVEVAMARLDAKCTVEQFNLLEIMISGRAVMGVMKELYPGDGPPPSSKGTVVLAALEGDVHDIGKNIVKMVFTATGIHVVDCGKDCPLPRLVETAVGEQPLVVGISGLITTIVPKVRQVREKLDAQGLEHVRIMAGGAALKQASAASLNVDFVATDAFHGLAYMRKLLEGQP